MIKSLLTIVFIFSGSLSFAGITINEKYLLPGISYIEAGASAATTSTAYSQIAIRNTAGAKNFYLTHFTVEGFLNTPSATATKLGACSLQIPAGSTVATYTLFNPTTSQVDRTVLTPVFPIVVPVSFVFSCVPVSSSSIVWTVNYGGFEY